MLIRIDKQSPITKALLAIGRSLPIVYEKPLCIGDTQGLWIHFISKDEFRVATYRCFDGSSFKHDTEVLHDEIAILTLLPGAIMRETIDKIRSQNPAERRDLWAVLLGLKPYRDGDKWCVVIGRDIQEGVAAFADTPEEAMWAFDRAFKEEKGQV